MVFIIENFWPEFVAMFAEENPTPEKLQQCLRNQFPGREAEENFRRILDHPKEFWEAVYGKEIPRIPRRIAYALAGVGKMTLRSSMARCDREPCELRIQLRAMDEHIRREHLAWHRKLASDSSASRNGWRKRWPSSHSAGVLRTKAHTLWNRSRRKQFRLNLHTELVPEQQINLSAVRRGEC
jgi:hypothetical protein